MIQNLRRSENSIIRQLEAHARQPASSIGKRIRRSQQIVSYTLGALHKKDIVKGFYSLIDYSRLSVLSFRVYFKLIYLKDKNLHDVIKHLSTRDDTGWVVTCGGKYDLICTFFARNVSSFNKSLREIIERFKDQIQAFSILTTIVIRLYDREYLLTRSAQPKEYFIGGDRDPVLVDSIDMSILASLSQNARCSAVELAKGLDITSKTAINRLRALERKGIIKGYKPLLNMPALGYDVMLLLIKYHNVSVEMEERLTSYLRAHPNVVSIVKTLGERDIEVRVEAKDQREFRKIEIEIRSKFATLINDIESLPLYETHKSNYFPTFLATEQSSSDQ